jgi:hypothetical protein
MPDFFLAVLAAGGLTLRWALVLTSWILLSSLFSLIHMLNFRLSGSVRVGMLSVWLTLFAGGIGALSLGEVAADLAGEKFAVGTAGDLAGEKHEVSAAHGRHVVGDHGRDGGQGEAERRELGFGRWVRFGGAGSQRPGGSDAEQAKGEGRNHASNVLIRGGQASRLSLCRP